MKTPPSHRAFTAIELLASIAVLVVLSVLLVSVSRQVAATARETRSAQNLKNIGLLVLAYAGEHRGRIPEHTQAGARITTASYHLSSGAAPRRLYAANRWGLSGQGDRDYLTDPSILYSPLVPEYRFADGLFFRAANGSYYMGYMYYYMPRHDETGRAPLLAGLYNDRVTESKNAPIYSEILFAAQDRHRFIGDRISVVYLDGRVESFSYDELLRLRTMKERILKMSGLSPAALEES